MSRGDERFAWGRTLCLRSDGRFTEEEIREEPKMNLNLFSSDNTNKPTNPGLPFQLPS